MVILLTVIHVIICVFLVIVVLLQSGKAADLAGAFGGMGSQTAFGPRGGATLLSRATTVAAALFMVTSLSLAIAATRGGSAVGSSSILEREKSTAGRKAPAQPAIPAGPGTGVPTSQPSISVVPQGGGKPINIPVQAPPVPLGKAGTSTVPIPVTPEPKK
ncbi:MAG: preprotein translocase subunit SecG [Acidobacteria bacterium]|nr:preprotein translocase subunit SecG [Acidobacteriota bacterium]